ncbi:DUF4097 family beta strand repeat protein [Candidatus Poribacteria bacterium]|nr:DUF4097 family beta strand repeat protein [Candidatus Poribacteria bacterium]
MRKSFLIMILLPVCLCCCTVGDVKVEKTEFETFPASGIHEVKLNTENGRIECLVVEENSINIELEKWATGNNTDDALDNVYDIDVDIVKNSRTLIIDVDIPHRITTDYGCDVFIEIPEDIALDLDTSNGSINLSGVYEDFKCYTSNGSIITSNTRGDAELRTSNGSVTIRDHRGNLNARTSSGKISASVIIPDKGECYLKTSNGSISLSIPDNTSAYIKASTSNGNIDITGLDVVVTKMDRTKFEGRIGSGNADIDLETSNGSILIRDYRN